MMVSIVLFRVIAKAVTAGTTDVVPRVNAVMNNGETGQQPAPASQDVSSEPTIKREPVTVAILKPNR
jgi:hypothetical protein